MSLSSTTDVQGTLKFELFSTQLLLDKQQLQIKAQNLDTSCQPYWPHIDGVQKLT